MTKQNQQQEFTPGPSFSTPCSFSLCSALASAIAFLGDLRNSPKGNGFSTAFLDFKSRGTAQVRGDVVANSSGDSGANTRVMMSHTTTEVADLSWGAFMPEKGVPELEGPET